MKSKQIFLQKILLIFYFTGALFSCQNERNAADMRQIMSKDEILNQLNKVSSFDVTGFSENIVSDSIPGTNFKKAIRYVLDISYVDSEKMQQNKKGIVLFTPDGKSILNARIADK